MKWKVEMKRIKVMETKYDLKSMYRLADELSERALLGFMVKAGLTDDTIFGGAFAVLLAVNRCDGLYKLLPFCDNKENEKKIIHIVECAMNGEWDDLAISRKDATRIVRRISEY